MPDEIKPDEASEEQAQPENENAAVNAVADQAEESAEADPEAQPADSDAEAEADAEGEAAAGAGESEDSEETPDDPDKSSEEADAEAAMAKMFEEGEDSPADADDNPEPQDEFPDLSHVKMEQTMASPAEFQQLNPRPAAADTANNIDLLLDVKMPVSIELGRTDMPISEILTLGPGSIVELDKLAGEPVDLLVNDKIIAKGEVVVVDENFGVRITMLMSPEERLKSLAQQ
jgi:flagellar motor switch protein FliN/FliY